MGCLASTAASGRSPGSPQARLTLNGSDRSAEQHNQGWVTLRRGTLSRSTRAAPKCSNHTGPD
jgi:hypothetical protein